MREAIGGSLLLNLVIIFASIIILFFISILSYSKAYRVKNRIIEITEKYGVYDSQVANEINSDLSAAGYDVSSPTKCSDIRERLISEKYPNEASGEERLSGNLNSYGYNYCVFEILNNSVNETGTYYVVVTFVKFEFPIIGDMLTIPVYSETKMLGKTYDY